MAEHLWTAADEIWNIDQLIQFIKKIAYSKMFWEKCPGRVVTKSGKTS